MFKCPVSENRLATLRPELIEAFVCFRYVLFTQHMSAKFLKERDVKVHPLITNPGSYQLSFILATMQPQPLIHLSY